jgi:transposase
MLKLNFTKEQIEQLREARFHHPHPRVQRKMEALLLKSKGLPNAAIAELVGIAHNTLLRYFHQFQEGGVATLKELNFYRPTSALAAHQDSLAAYFQTVPVTSITHAQDVIEKHTGLRRSPTQVRQFLLKLGVKRRKVGQIPAKADLEKQAEFLADELQPRLAEATKGTRQVFF